MGVRWNADSQEEEWLVQWKQHPHCDATWEAAYMMRLQFPNLHLEDKVHFSQGSIVRPPILHTYVRKGKKVIAGGQGENVP